MLYFRTLVRLNFPRVPETLYSTLLILTLEMFRHHLSQIRSGSCLGGHLFQRFNFMDVEVSAPSQGHVAQKRSQDQAPGLQSP